MSESKNSVLEFGQELINARNYKKISLEQISEITKITVPYLQAMEEGEWDLLPHTYMEVFLRAYAEAVGMNVPKVMKKYREMTYSDVRANDQPDLSEESEYKDNFIGIYSLLPQWLQKDKLKWAGGVLAIIVIIVLILILIPGKGGDESVEGIGDPEQEASTGGQTAQEDQTKGSESLPEDDNLTQSTEAVVQAFTLRARALERCWLQATIDKSEVRDVTLYPEDNLTLRAYEEIHLVVGNAGGLEIDLNGQYFDSLGSRGQPVTLVFDSDGIMSQRLGAWRLNYLGEIQSVPADSVPQDLDPN